jgi:hypothetical protein
MSALTTSLIVFTFVFGGALVGIALRRVLPQHHLNSESRNVLTMSQGIVGTMVAIVLGLLIASAHASYDMQRNELMEIAAKLVLLDHILVHYGPEAKDARDLLRKTVGGAIDRMWGDSPGGVSTEGEALYDQILELSPKDDSQRTLKTQATNTVLELGRTRFLINAQGSNSISRPLLIVVVFWLVVILMSFGLFAPTNTTVVSALFITALSVSGAIFLTLELYQPFRGLIQLSSAPLHSALAQLGH